MGDSYIIRHGQSNRVGGLNCRIFGMNSKPSKPKENDIYVPELEKVEHWMINPVPKDAVNLPNNSIAILSDVTSDLNRINLSTKQYLGFSLGRAVYSKDGVTDVSKAEVFLDGKWKRFSTPQMYLFNGKDNVSVTGGWSKTMKTVDLDHGTFILKDTPSSRDETNSCYTLKSFHVSAFRRIVVKFKKCIVVPSGELTIGIWKPEIPFGPIIKSTYVSNGMKEAVVDISGVDSEAVFKFSMSFVGTSTSRKLDLEIESILFE